ILCALSFYKPIHSLFSLLPIMILHVCLAQKGKCRTFCRPSHFFWRPFCGQCIRCFLQILFYLIPHFFTTFLFWLIIRVGRFQYERYFLPENGQIEVMKRP